MPAEPAEAWADVSVVVPAYRAAGTIGRALAGVAAQTVRPRQVVVVDDGSDDGTLAATEACRESLGEIDLIALQQPNRGAGAARNRAVAAATQPLLAFLDADDEWLPEHLEQSLAVMAAGGHRLVAHNGWIVAPDGHATLNDCAARFREPRDPFVTLYRKGYIDTCTVVCERGAVIAAGGFDEALPNAQDFELWLALLREPGTPFTVFEAPLARYHLTGGSIMSHTQRRLDCCLVVAERFAPDLRRRPGSMAASLVFRIASVHWEAAQVYRAGGRWGALTALIAAAPFRTLAVLARVVVGRPPPRKAYLT